MTADIDHTDVAAYALGLLEEDDRRAFEAHLAHCTVCTEEMADFAGLAEALSGIEPVEDDPIDKGDPPAEGNVIDLLRRRKVAQRRRRRGTGLLCVAAGVALFAGGIAAGATGPQHHDHNSIAADLLGWGETRSARDARTGVSGTVAMESKAWGTHVALDITNVKGPVTCELVAVSKMGEEHVVTEWAVSPKGDIAPQHLQVHGGTAVQRADLARFEVRVEGSGGALLSVAV